MCPAILVFDLALVPLIEKRRDQCASSCVEWVVHCLAVGEPATLWDDRQYVATADKRRPSTGIV